MLKSALFISAERFPPRRQLWSLAGSFLAHALTLWVMVRQPAPVYVKVVEVRAGSGGQSMAIFYSASAAETDRVLSRSDSSSAARKLILRKIPPRKVKSKAPRAQTTDVANLGSLAALPAGQPSGFSLYGVPFGPEVRPALPLSGPNPRASLDELPNRQEGVVIVEITIDEQGNVVRTRVLQSMGSEIDERAIRALMQWHFKPATRNGQTIPSLQDVHFHFPM